MKNPIVNKKLLECFELGYEAFTLVALRKKKFFHQRANPMKTGTIGHKEWQRGGNTAYFHNLEKLNGLGTRG